MTLTHFDGEGNARMVDVGGKNATYRTAVAEGFIRINEEIQYHIQGKSLKKGDVLSVAQLAGIMGAKHTSSLIPLCHPLPLTKVEVKCELLPDKGSIRVEATVATEGVTGVEMEALTAVQIALLTVYDMCTAVDKNMEIGPVRLLSKNGGKSDYMHSREREERNIENNLKSEDELWK